MTTFIYIPFFGQPQVYHVYRYRYIYIYIIYIYCRCLSSESCNLYQIFSVGSLSRADWKQQLDSAAASHQSPNGRFEQRKAKAKRSRKVELTGKTYTCTFCGCIFGHVFVASSLNCRRLLHAFYLLEASSHIVLICGSTVQWLRSDVSFVVAFATVERLWLFWLLFQQRPQTAWTYNDSIGLHKCGCNGE